MYTPRMLHRTRVLRRPAGALHRSVHGEGGRAAETRSVLLLPKTPRWRHELASRGLSEVVARELLARGEAWPRAAQMCQANDAHAASVAHLERCFGEAGIAVRTLAAAEATAAQVAAHAPALVCTAGGDGTLLRTATLLPPSTPLLAINTDPAPSYVQNGLSPAARVRLTPGYGAASWRSAGCSQRQGGLGLPRAPVSVGKSASRPEIMPGGHLGLALDTGALDGGAVLGTDQPARVRGVRGARRRLAPRRPFLRAP